MAGLALALFGLWATVAFGLRAAIQIRRTGDSGLRGAGGPIGSAGWWARVLFVAALVTGLAAPVVDLAGAAAPIDALDTMAVAVAGTALATTGIVATLWAQLAMGHSWRIGVDAGERTELVTAGPFRLVRNPIYTAMALTSVGLAAIVPNAVAMAGLVVLLVALEVQVRVVEEPYLVATHGDTYLRYAADVGRFAPGAGRLPHRRAAMFR